MYLTYTSRMMECRRDGFDEGFTVGREEGISIGLERGLEQGLEQGAYQTKLETAKNLLSMNFTPTQVAQGTKLPLDVVMGLAHYPLQDV